MATSFSEVRQYIRAALMDTDSSMPLFSDDALTSQIRLTILSLLSNGKTEYQENGSSMNFIRDLSPKQKVIVSITSAIRVLSSLPESFSYASPIMKVSRNNPKAFLLLELEGMLSSVEGGTFVIKSDSDIDAIVNGTIRYSEAIDSAIAKGS